MKVIAHQASEQSEHICDDYRDNERNTRTWWTRSRIIAVVMVLLLIVAAVVVAAYFIVVSLSSILKYSTTLLFELQNPLGPTKTKLIYIINFRTFASSLSSQVGALQCRTDFQFSQTDISVKPCIQIITSVWIMLMLWLSDFYRDFLIPSNL